MELVKPKIPGIGKYVVHWYKSQGHSEIIRNILDRNSKSTLDSILLKINMSVKNTFFTAMKRMLSRIPETRTNTSAKYLF